MIMNEKVIEILIDKLTDIELSDFDIMHIIISNPKTTEIDDICEIDIKLTLKKKYNDTKTNR